MSENPYTNLDARSAQALADHMHECLREGQDLMLISEVDIAMLRRAAQHLQSMDEKLSRHIDGSFAEGALFEKRDGTRMRSNILPSGREIRDENGARIIAALDQGPEKIHRIPAGLRATPKPQVVEITTRKSAPARTGFKLGDL